MTKNEIIKWCISVDLSAGHLVIPEEMFQSLSESHARIISGYFNNNQLIKLPAREIAFFEWLKSEEPEVWDDLWKQSVRDPYIVSISFLPLLTDKLTGFPICDLLKNDNFYFTDELITDKEAEIFVESTKQRFLDKEKLTPSQALMMQISLQPTDIWHFAFYFHVDLKTAKDTVNRLAEDKMLIHLTEANHLAPFIKF